MCTYCTCIIPHTLSQEVSVWGFEWQHWQHFSQQQHYSGACRNRLGADFAHQKWRGLFWCHGSADRKPEAERDVQLTCARMEKAMTKPPVQFNKQNPHPLEAPVLICKASCCPVPLMKLPGNQAGQKRPAITSQDHGPHDDDNDLKMDHVWACGLFQHGWRQINFNSHAHPSPFPLSPRKRLTAYWLICTVIFLTCKACCCPVPGRCCCPPSGQT